jgi:putative ABC transport system permease protein
MKIFILLLRSLHFRKVSTVLSILSLSLALFLSLFVERVRTGIRSSFESTVSGAHLLVGARTGEFDLLLSSLFGLGNLRSQISPETYEAIRKNPDVEWTIPLALGDSHQGYRVVGTDENFFNRFRYARSKGLSFQVGGPFRDQLEVVIGFEVARRLHYRLGDQVIITHGLSELALDEELHSDHPFTVVGIFNATGTPIDQQLYVSMESLSLIHEGLPTGVSAFLLRAKRMGQLLELHRAINQSDREPMTAIFPQASLQELWRSLSAIEWGFRILSLGAVALSLIFLMAQLLQAVEYRRRELAILRALGASRPMILFFVQAEYVFLFLTSLVLSVLWFFVFRMMSIWGWGDLAESIVGMARFGPGELTLIFVLFGIGFVAALVPTWRAYRNSLADGLSPQV